ncbi:MAG: ABC transporter permease, partial [Ruminiclostridium sp.]|nr:ABC transporter permease [Ruminiclostridium sp.]
MSNLWLMLATDYKKNLDRTYDRLNDGHVTIYAYRGDEEFKKFADSLPKNRSDITEYCVTDSFGFVGTFKFNGGNINTNFIFMEKNAALSRNVGRIEIVEDSDLTSGIYLPMIYGTNGNYSVGDEIEITMGSETLNYTVCGFLNSASAGSHNCAMCAMLLTEDKYKELSDLGTIPSSTLISARITDKTGSETVETELSDAIAGAFPGINAVSSSYMLVSTSRYISQSICASILSAMAFLITLIAVVVISSNVMNYIHEDMQNLGAMKAIGYRSGQLTRALILQFSGTMLVTAIVGIALSYTIFPALNEMMISQTGIPYSVNFLPIPCVVTLLFTVGAVTAAVYFSARRIRKIEPITALRQGIQTHSFKKNHVPLDQSNTPLNFSLALKTVMSNQKQNVTICVT